MPGWPFSRAIKDLRSDRAVGTYNIQRTFLVLLGSDDLREERVPNHGEGATRGELVFYNLGKFSQAISDFEQINFQRSLSRRYQTFASGFNYQAPDFYEESDQDLRGSRNPCRSNFDCSQGKRHAVARRLHSQT